MDAFWQWLMKANAKAVCLGLLALLLGVSGFWAWKIFLQERKLATPVASAPKERERITLGLMDILQKEAANPPVAPAQSPFFTRYSPPIPVPIHTNAPHIIPTRTGHTVTPPPPTPPPPPPPPPEKTTITFRGTMERPDGIVQAMFEVSNSTTKRTTFVRRKDSICGLLVDSISLTGTVSVVRLDGTTNDMGVGNFEEITEKR